MSDPTEEIISNKAQNTQKLENSYFELSAWIERPLTIIKKWPIEYIGTLLLLVFTFIYMCYVVLREVIPTLF